MPSRSSQPISPPALVAVTGANGFIASHCIAQLLEAGYHVLGTVRDSKKVEQVLKTHSAADGASTRLSVAIVADITDANAYITAFSRASAVPVAIFHLAAPFSYTVTNFETDLLIPALKGTEAILTAANHFQADGLRRVIHTNSFACIYDAAAGLQPGRVYTASDWSPLTYADGVSAPNAPTAYRAAKTVAEKSAWDFMKTHANELSFDLVSLCPAMVFGPFLSTAMPASPAELNTSNASVWGIVSAGEHAAVPPTRGPVWVDVRDVARAHVLALTAPNISGERLLLAAGVYCNQEIADEARVALPKWRERIPIGQSGQREASQHFDVDASRTEEVLGLKWTGLRECLTDLVPQLFEIESKAANGVENGAAKPSI